MLFSNVVMYFVILANAATLHQAGHTNITTVAEAAQALAPLAGEGATVLMALGLIGTGLLAVPILTGSAAYAVCEAFGWKCSLDAAPAKARSLPGRRRLDHCRHVDAPVRHQRNASPVLDGRHQWLFGPAPARSDHAYQQQPGDYGARVNGRLMNLMGWLTALLVFAAAAGLVCTWAF